ncbi:MAG: MBG domain-containing protein, partial [Acidobacteria bacterium]|nr:MBG domain-containing protein [Acidobacteriota bacterium]
MQPTTVAKSGTAPKNTNPLMRSFASLIGLDEEPPAEEQEIKVATIATDRSDYAPGDIVNITGSGWKAASVDAAGNTVPGETVTLVLHEERETAVHDDITLTSVADENGKIQSATYAPEEHDLGVTYTLTATGDASGLTAVTTFSDAITSPASVSVSTSTLTPCEGAQVVFTVGSVTGFNVATKGNADTVNYQWYRGTTPVGTQGSRTITANNTLSTPSIQLAIASATPADSGIYSIQMWNSTGQANTVTSNSAMNLAVTAKAKITTQPAASQSVVQGSTVNFSVTATGAKADGSDLTYLWKKDGANISNSAAKGISGATTSSLTLSNVTNKGNTNNDSGTYTVVVTSSGSSCGSNSVTSNGAVLSVASQASTGLNTAAAAGAFGGSTSLSATLTSNNSALSGATVSFTLNGSSVGSATTDASGVATLSNVSLGSTAAGSYAAGIGASYAGDSSNLASSSTSSLTVNQADTVTTISGSSFAYDGNGHGASVSVKGNGNDITNNVNALTVTYAPQGSASDSSAAPVNAGTYDVYVVHNGNSNFKSQAKSKLGTITIGKADPTVTAAGGTFTYDGAAHAGGGNAKGVNSVDLGAVSLSYSSNGTALAGAPTNAGTYSVTASFPGNGNYNAKSSAAGQIVIDQAGATITVAGGGTFTYDGNAHAATASAKGVNNEDLGAVGVGYAQGGSAVQGAPVNAGTYDVNASFPGNGNYKASGKAAQIVINQADASITATGGTFTYTGNAQGGSASAKGVKGEDLGVSTSYAEGATALQGAPTEAGTYTLTASFPGNGNYKGSSKTAGITINPANATLSANGGTFTYTGDPQGGSGSAKGVKNEDLAVSIGYAEGANAMQGAPTEAGTYTVNVSLNSNRNYNAASKSATITIGKANATA